MSTEPRELITKILNSYTQEMEGYSYFGKNPGISIDDYEEIASEIVKQLNIQTLEQKLAVAIRALETAHKEACSCCDSNWEVEEHCKKALALINPDAQKAGTP